MANLFFHPQHCSALGTTTPCLPQTAEVRIAVNAELLGRRRVLEVQGGGRLVLGRNLGSVDGDFNAFELLDGEVTDYRIYDVALGSKQLKEWVECKTLDFFNAPLISFGDSKFKLVGEVEFDDIAISDLCAGIVTDFSLLFTEKMDFHRASAWCEIIGGHMALPKSNYENELIWNATVHKKDECSSSWTYLTWLGIVGDPQTLEWRGLMENKSLAFSNFLPIYRSVSEQYQCVATVSHTRYSWAASPCDMETCTLCRFTSYPALALRGLCKLSLIDRKFTFHESEDLELSFEGYSHVEVVKVNGIWTMLSRRYKELQATMVQRYDGEFPLGVHRWKVVGDKCQDKKVRLEFSVLLYLL